MASHTRDSTVGLPASFNYQEACNLKLAAEHFPISCSLRMQLEETIAKGSRNGNDPIMPVEDLLGYLKNPSDLDLTPYADLLNQTEAMGDPALPSWEHTVILRWFGEAWHFYEQRFPLEEPLTSTIRKLKPLAATFAITDPDFMQPDVHPLHQLLDSIQERAVGWQASLGRAGANLERQIATAVDDALRWFEDDSTDLSAICSDFLHAAERDHDRARRMSQRVIDTELGKQKTATAKTTAASMINSVMDKQETPTELGAFLKGPWYESAQLLLLKFGESSDEWRKMCRTTEIMLDSMQSLEGVGEDRRQHVFSVVTKLPKEMRRWLLSLHHDTAAVNEAIEHIESLHVRLLKNEDVPRSKQGPIPTAVADTLDEQSPLIKAMNALRESQWFAIRNFKGSTIRVQLALKNATAQRMVFTNMAGMAVAHYSFEEFDQIMGKKNVIALPASGGFSLCLALASGIDTTEKLNALYANIAGVDLVPEVEDDPGIEAAGEMPDLVPSIDKVQLQDEPENNQGLGGMDALIEGDIRGASSTDEEGEEEITAEFLDAILNADPPEEEEAPAQNSQQADAAQPMVGNTTAGNEEKGREALDTPPDEHQDSWLSDTAAENTPLSQGDDFLGVLDDSTGGDDSVEFTFNDSAPSDSPFEDNASEESDGSYFGSESSDDSFFSELESAPAQTPPTEMGETEQPQEDSDQDTQVESLTDIGYFGAETAADEDIDSLESYLSEDAAPAEHPTLPEAIPAADHLDLPMGVWLGFHDGETPMMAKLAVHDPSADLYIFVNRNGIKLRELSGTELSSLLQTGMAEILHTSSNS